MLKYVGKGWGFMSMLGVIFLSILIIAFVLIVFVIAITKGYSYKHKVDPIDNNPHLKQQNSQITED